MIYKLTVETSTGLAGIATAKGQTPSEYIIVMSSTKESTGPLGLGTTFLSLKLSSKSERKGVNLDSVPLVKNAWTDTASALIPLQDANTAPIHQPVEVARMDGTWIRRQDIAYSSALSMKGDSLIPIYAGTVTLSVLLRMGRINAQTLSLIHVCSRRAWSSLLPSLLI